MFLISPRFKQEMMTLDDTQGTYATTATTTAHGLGSNLNKQLYCEKEVIFVLLFS